MQDSLCCVSMGAYALCAYQVIRIGVPVREDVS